MNRPRDRASANLFFQINWIDTPVPEHWMDGAWRMFIRRPDQLPDLVIVTDDPPSRSGVYFLWSSVGGLLYIGKANDLYTRLRQHDKQGRILFATYSYIQTPAPLALLVEAAYIFALQPPYNLKYLPSRWPGQRRMERLIRRLWEPAQVPAAGNSQ